MVAGSPSTSDNCNTQHKTTGRGGENIERKEGKRGGRQRARFVTYGKRESRCDRGFAGGVNAIGCRVGLERGRGGGGGGAAEGERERVLPTA